MKPSIFKFEKKRILVAGGQGERERERVLAARQDSTYT
jgi:hypothetical protein